MKNKKEEKKRAARGAEIIAEHRPDAVSRSLAKVVGEQSTRGDSTAAPRSDDETIGKEATSNPAAAVNPATNARVVRALMQRVRPTLDDLLPRAEIE